MPHRTEFSAREPPLGRHVPMSTIRQSRFRSTGSKLFLAALEESATAIPAAARALHSHCRGRHRERCAFSQTPRTVAIKRALEPIERAAAKQRQGMRGTDIRRSSPQVRMGVPSTRSQPSWGWPRLCIALALQFRARPISYALVTDWLVGHIGLELANPSASYLIGIA